MTDENRKILERINAYAENVLGEIDPQKIQVSVQLEKLRPVMEEIAAEQGATLEDVFILYMDLQSEASCTTNQKLKDSLQDINDGFDGGSPLLFR
jgi:DNA-binding phage protein